MAVDPIMGEYDEIMTVDGHRVFVTWPRITPEENERRWEHVCEVATKIHMNVASRQVELLAKTTT